MPQMTSMQSLHACYATGMGMVNEDVHPERQEQAQQQQKDLDQAWMTFLAVSR